MKKKFLGTLLLFLAALWPFLARYTGEFFREFVIYEQASKLLHWLVDQAPIEVLWQIGPPFTFAAIGVLLHFWTKLQPTEHAAATHENDPASAIREWVSSYNVFVLADPSLAKKVADAEQQVAKLAQHMSAEERLLFQLDDQGNALVLLQPVAATKLRIIANRTAVSLQMIAMQQQLDAARAKALDDIYAKLKSRKLVARGFLHPIRQHVMELEIPAAHWRIIRLTGDYTQAQGQGIKYSGIAITRSR